MHVRTQRWALRAALGTVILAVAGCSALPSRPASTVRYDLGLAEVLPRTTAAAPAASASAPALPLVLADVQAPSLPEVMTAMLYRLLYADGQQLRAYQSARWSLPPGQMLAQRLRMRLGQVRPVLSPRDDISFNAPDHRTLAVLRVELDEFSQVFDSVSSSHALVRIRASLIARNGPSGGNVLQGQTVLTARAPAPTADAAGGAQAMVLAVDDVTAQLNRWLQDYGR